MSDKKPRGRPRIEVSEKTMDKLRKIWVNNKVDRKDRVEKIREIVGHPVSEPWIYSRLGPTGA